MSARPDDIAAAAASAPPPPPRRRRGRWLLWLAAVVVALVLLVLLALWWVLSTGGGRDFALARAMAALPPGALTVGRSEGSLRGPLTLYDVHYDDGDVVVTARRVHLVPALRQLLSRTLALRALEIDDTTVRLPPASEDPPDEAPPGWPDVLPEVELPLSLVADAVVVRNAVVEQDGAHLVAIRTLTAAADLADGRLHLRGLDLDSDRGALRLDADYAPRENFRTRLAGNATLPAHAGRDPVALRIDAEGDLARFVLDLEGAAPGPLRVHVDLVDGGTTTPTWRLSATAPALEPALFAPPPADGGQAEAAPLDIALDASGTGGRAELSGRVAQGELEVEIAPSRIAYEAGVLTMSPLALRLYDGEVALEGSADFNPEVPTLDAVLRLAGLRIEGAEGEAVVVQEGAFSARGALDAWRVEGEARVARGGDSATLRVDATGDTESAVLDRLAVDTPSGDLDGRGSVRWSPALEWELAATLDGVDPGYFAPDFPGALRGALTTRGRQDDAGVLHAQADLPDLRGRLRGHALRASVAVDWRGDAGTVDLDAAIGDSRIAAEGTVGNRLDVAVRLDPLNLPELLPDTAGTLRGRARVRGTNDAPDISADLVGSGLRYGDMQAERLSIQGDLPWRGSNGALAVRAVALDLGAVAFDTLDADVQGALAAPRLQASARGPDLGVDVAATLEQTARGWQGEVGALRLAPSTGAAWALQGPARFAQVGDALRLDRACFVPEGAGGSLCAEADWPRSASVRGQDVPLSLLDPWLSRDDGAPMRAFGLLQLEADIAPAGDGWNGSFALTSRDGGVRLRAQGEREVVGYDSIDLRGRIAGDSVEATLALQMADAEGRIDGRLATGMAETAPLDGEFVLDVGDLTFIELFSVDVAAPTGHIGGRVLLGGTRAAPQLSGGLLLRDFGAELPALGIALSEGRIALDALPSGEARIDGSLRSGDGVLAIAGGLRLDAPMQTLEMTVRGENVTVSDTAELHARASPDLSIRLREDAVHVRGRVGVPYLRLDLEGLESTTSPSADVVVLDPIEPVSGPGAPLDLDLTLAMGEDVRLQGFGFDGKLDGTLRVRQHPGREMLGSGGLNVTGRYESYGQDLTIEYGRLSWASAPLDNPALDVRAVREVGDITVGLQVRGTVLQPETEVISDPAMDQSEALSYLVLGRSLRTASGEDSQQLGAAAAALSAGSNLLAEKIGARLGFDEAGISDSRALGGSALTVGRYISPRLYVSYGVSLLGTGQVLGFRYLLARGFDIQIESGLENRASLNWRTER
ncbi:translocation/assembly module TamB domain-containing protein [Coralloluteibacterium thermophilus]|uniref:Translocation/assembly module TamB domain-containing protein n=1 Tax=Coralloluteibacterium thermophilum TaxID=2707049 RepID=A0ABV9NNJ1_9GAMM